MSSPDGEIVTTISDSTALVRLNRPHKRNSLSTTVLEQLRQVLVGVIARADVHKLVITGTREVFTAGADINELLSLTPETAVEFAHRGREVCDLLAGTPQLTIAAISGPCMGGGLDLALACDLRVAGPDARFAHPGAKIGVITGWGGTQRLPRLIGRTRALEMLLTARVIGAEEALSIGLVNFVSITPVEFAQNVR